MPEDTTPLLSADALQPTPDHNPEGVENEYPRSTTLLSSSGYFVRPIKILTRINLLSAVISSAVLLAADLAWRCAPFNYSWIVRDNIVSLGGIVTIFLIYLCRRLILLAFLCLRNCNH